MGWIRDLFTKASELDRLRRDNQYLQGCLDRDGYKIVELEKQILKERARVDKFLMTYADQISVKNGLYAKFVEKPKEPPKPVIASDKIQWAAEQQRKADIETYGEDNVQPLTFYVQELESNPDHYII